jgi:hypothetical protein
MSRIEPEVIENYLKPATFLYNKIHNKNNTVDEFEDLYIRTHDDNMRTIFNEIILFYNNINNNNNNSYIDNIRRQLTQIQFKITTNGVFNDEITQINKYNKLLKHKLNLMLEMYEKFKD